MISNKTKRNIWLVLSIMSVFAVFARIIRVATGSIEWWNLAISIVVFALCVKFYLCYRRQVKSGNLFGRVNPLKKG